MKEQRHTAATPPDRHPGELLLRRLWAGETAGPSLAWAKQHLGACERCQTRWRGLEAEAQAFKAQLPWERFAQGVEGQVQKGASDAQTRGEARARGAVAGAQVRRGSRLRPAGWWVGWGALVGLGTAAAVLVLWVGVRPAGNDALDGLGSDGVVGAGGASVPVSGPRARTKGPAPELWVQVVDAQGVQRRGQAPVEPLAPGERARLGFKPGSALYWMAVAVDHRGTVTSLYPEDPRDGSLSVDGGGLERLQETLFLPDALELVRDSRGEGQGNGKDDGQADGREMIVLVLAEEPFASAPVGELVAAVVRQTGDPEAAAAMLSSQPCPAKGCRVLSQVFVKP